METPLTPPDSLNSQYNLRIQATSSKFALQFLFHLMARVLDPGS